jgi:hypothetical protein
MGWVVNSTTRPLYPRKRPGIGGGWAPRPVWTDAENLVSTDSIPGECEEYQPHMLITNLMITKSTVCIFTLEMDSSPQTVLKMDTDTALKRLDRHLSLHGVTLQKEI